MRAAFAVLLCSELATACPRQTPTDVSTSEAPTVTSCFGNIDWSAVQRVFELRYAIGAGGTSRRGIGSAALGFAALDLAYGLQFGGEPAQPSYEIEVTAGAAAQRFGGAFDATGLVTRAGMRLGPARIAASVVDDGRANVAVFPLTLELAHAGELSARPRISDRPIASRALFDRERVEMTTRLVRVEGAGEKASALPPGQTPDKKPTNWAIDVFPLHAGLDVTRQDATTRYETSVGGAMLGAVEHSRSAKLDFFGLEYRAAGDVDIFTVWMLRIDAVDPHTGTQYTIGWGETVLPDSHDRLGHHFDEKDGTPSIGGFGWFTHRAWGGFGMQYKREAYVALTGDIGIEDRVHGEAYLARGSLGLVSRVFGARHRRVMGDAIVEDLTGGIEVAGTYTTDGWTGRVGLELGRTFYTALDDGMPLDTGFVAALGVTMQHAGARAWKR